MEKYSDIIQFSRDLFLHSHENFPFHYKYKIVLKPPRSIKAASETLEIFSDAFCTKLNKLYRQHLSEVVDSDEQFFRYVIPRCLKLVDDDNYYFSFMLVAAFIYELLAHFMFERDCYLFTGVAYKCLVAVYKRRLEENFEKNGGWKGLRAFWKKVSTADDSKFKTLTDLLTGGDRSYKKQVHQRIKKCDVIQCEDFVLNDYELLLLTIDDQLTIETLSNGFIMSPVDSPLEVEWSVVKDDQIVKVCSRFDDESGAFISTVVPSSNAESSSVSDAGPTSSVSDAGPTSSVSDAGPTSSVSDAGPTSSVSDAGPTSSISNSDSQPPVVEDSISKRSIDHNSVSDDESISDEEPDCEVPPLEEIATGYIANFMVRLLNPREFDQKKSAHTCNFCKKRCFQYSKFLFVKHGLVSMKPKRFRKTKFFLTNSLKSIGKIFSNYT